MTVTAKDIERTAHLARLRIDDTEIPLYTQNLNNLLLLVDKMGEVNTDSIAPLSHPIAQQHQRLREDKVTEKDQRQVFQTLTAQTTEGLYIVPKVIESIADEEG